MNDIKPKIVIVGVGGAGSNILKHLISESNMAKVDLIFCNTDSQALNEKQKEYNNFINKVSSAEDNNKEFPSAQFIQLGPEIAQGLGAGMDMEVGKKAAQESIERDMFAALRGADMVFVVAGMGGGTGTGASSIIAAEAKNLGALTISVATKPFFFEGQSKVELAKKGLKDLKESSDTVLIIENQHLLSVNNISTLFIDALNSINEILKSMIRTFTDLIYNSGLINLDFADITNVMKNSCGTTVIGTGIASSKNLELSSNNISNEKKFFIKNEGNNDGQIVPDYQNRALQAVKNAINCPLLANSSIVDAENIIINIAGGEDDLKLFEVESVLNYIFNENYNSKIFFGTSIDNELSKTNSIKVSIIASGINENNNTETQGNINQNTYNIQNDSNNSLNEDSGNNYNSGNKKSSNEFKNENFNSKEKKLSFLERIMGGSDKKN